MPVWCGPARIARIALRCIALVRRYAKQGLRLVEDHSYRLTSRASSAAFQTCRLAAFAGVRLQMHPVRLQAARAFEEEVLRCTACRTGKKRLFSRQMSDSQRALYVSDARRLRVQLCVCAGPRRSAGSRTWMDMAF